MSEIILLKTKGGLGNQLFQIAAAMACQKVLGGNIYVMASDNKHSAKDYIKIFSTLQPLYNDIQTEFYYNQTDGFGHWNPESFSLYKSVSLDGYFQYLPPIQSVIDDMGHFICDYTEYNSYAFLHVRRGDYLYYSHIHHILPQSYYETALKGFNSNILVISDDIAWCKQQPWLSSYKMLEEDDELKTLSIMASCKKGAIIANSTFSWWGAILGKSGNVYYPSLWYLNIRPNMFPDSWKCI